MWTLSLPSLKLRLQDVAALVTLRVAAMVAVAVHVAASFTG